MSTEFVHGRIFSIGSEDEFESIAMEIFTIQYHGNALYQRFCDALERDPGRVQCTGNIPFLPVEFFRDHKVITGGETGGATGGDTDGTTGGDTDGVTGGDADGVTGGDTDGVTGGDADGVTGGDADGATGADADGATGGDADGATGGDAGGVIFTSSGTTGMNRSSHHVTDSAIYQESFTRGFSRFFGDPGEVVILALLPSYLERDDSSLIYMVKSLIGMSRYGGGFYLDDYTRLLKDIEFYRKKGRRVILFGVTFALLELAQKEGPDLSGITVMETGGMKGHGREMVREEVHSTLCRSFNVDAIASEYGMTELLSQAWSYGGGLFASPPWMRVLTRDLYDPLTINGHGEKGGISVIDLANINSCSFIATSDMGVTRSDGLFEITGRFDNSDVRGCNLLV